MFLNDGPWGQEAFMQRLKKIALVGTCLLLGACCDGAPEGVWQTGTFIEPTNGWRCSGPLGVTCFELYLSGQVTITAAGAGGTAVHQWSKSCVGLTLDGSYDGAVMSRFEGSIASSKLRFHWDPGAEGVEGDFICTLETNKACVAP